MDVSKALKQKPLELRSLLFFDFRCWKHHLNDKEIGPQFYSKLKGCNQVIHSKENQRCIGVITFFAQVSQEVSQSVEQKIGRER